MRVGKWANDLLSKPAFPCASYGTEIRFVALSGRDLGFMEKVRLREICTRAKEFGFHQSPSDAGPALRAVYEEQPLSERLIIAMIAVFDSKGIPRAFYVVNDRRGLGLYANFLDPEELWPPEQKFVFMQEE